MDLIQEGREKEREGGVEERRGGVERGRDMHCVVLSVCVCVCVCVCVLLYFCTGTWIKLFPLCSPSV